MSSSSNWTLFPKAPGGLVFDVQRSVTLPCRDTAETPRAICLVHPIISRGTPWRWSISNLGHTAQYLFKCWSFFQRHPTLPRHLVDLIENRVAFKQPWSIELMRAMGASFLRGMPQHCAVMWSVPTRLWFPGYGEAWFNSPRDARQLTAAVMGSVGRLPPGAIVGALRVGVLERGAIHYGTSKSHTNRARIWPGGEALVDMVRSQPPAGVASAERFYLHNQTLRQQARRTECRRSGSCSSAPSHPPHFISPPPFNPSHPHHRLRGSESLM